jgi:hypothetical protein
MGAVLVGFSAYRIIRRVRVHDPLRISDPVLHRTCDQRRSSARSSVSHLHQLFNADTCQSSLHTLRCNCKRIVQSTVGAGTTFTLTLPLVEP